MKPRVITALFIGLMVLLVVGYDFLALFLWGSDATISNVINIWAFTAHPLISFCFGFIIGGLVVHFLRWKPVNN